MRSAVALALLLATPAARAAETAEARAQARECLERSGERAVAACGRALERGLTPARAALVRRTLAAKLALLGRADEAVAVYRQAAQAEPDHADAHFRLGQALFALTGDAAAALAPLQRARELGPEEPRVHATLGQALAALGRSEEAVAAFETALRLDPAYLEHRPGARAAYEAARRGERWPPAEPARPTPP